MVQVDLCISPVAKGLKEVKVSPSLVRLISANKEILIVLTLSLSLTARRLVLLQVPLLHQLTVAIPSFDDSDPSFSASGSSSAAAAAAAAAAEVAASNGEAKPTSMLQAFSDSPISVGASLIYCDDLELIHVVDRCNSA